MCLHVTELTLVYSDATHDVKLDDKLKVELKVKSDTSPCLIQTTHLSQFHSGNSDLLSGINKRNIIKTNNKDLTLT